jgi:hypothetical protein
VARPLQVRAEVAWPAHSAVSGRDPNIRATVYLNSHAGMVGRFSLGNRERS